MSVSDRDLAGLAFDLGPSGRVTLAEIEKELLALRAVADAAEEYLDGDTSSQRRALVVALREAGR